MLPQDFDLTPPVVMNAGGVYVINSSAAAQNSQHLKNNQRYTVQVNLPGGTQARASFASAYDPLYTSVSVIRQDIGDLITNITDDQINFKIYQVSQTAQQLSGRAQRFLLFGSGIGNIQLQFTGVTRLDMRNAIPYPTPYYVQQYARFKAEEELVYAQYITLSSQAGMMEKDLGDLKVIRQVMIPKIQEVLADLKSNLREWEDQVRGGSTGKPHWTTRGRTHKYGPNRLGGLGDGGAGAGGNNAF